MEQIVSRFRRLLPAFFALLLSWLPLDAVRAEGQSEGGVFYQTYKRRQAQRFDLLSYLADQRRIRAEQDAKWGHSSVGLPFESDIVLSYAGRRGDVQRGALLGTVEEQDARVQLLMNGLFAEGSKRRLINIDVGFEGFYRQAAAFKAQTGITQTDWMAREAGGGLLLRPFGRSSQDTGLLLKGGWTTVKETGLWQSGSLAHSLSAPYVGGEAKLYLLPFLGARGEYTRTFAAEDRVLGGRWTQERLAYGAFLEIFFLSVEAQAFTTTYDLQSATGAAAGTRTRDQVSGVGFQASLFF